MSLFGNHIFGSDADLGQVTLPEPATDDLIHDLATMPTRTVTPTTSTAPPKAGAGFRPTVDLSTTSATPWVPYALVGGGIVIAGLLIWSATRRPRTTANRRRHRRRR